MSTPRPTAYRVDTPRLSLRCLEPAHHTMVSRAIAENLPRLSRFLPWALSEPLSEEQRIEWLRTQRGHFDLGGNYSFGVFEPDGSALLGGACLALTSDGEERDIGYWLIEARTGQGLASELTRALMRVAFDLEDVSAVNIRCQVANVASQRIPTRLGFSGPELEPSSLPWPGEGKRDLLLYWMSRTDYSFSEARRLAVRAYDVLGRPLTLASAP